MDGGALASPIGATATAVAPTTPKGKVTVRVIGRARVGGASRVVARASKRVKAAGRVSVGLRLSHAARKRLAAGGRLRVVLSTQFTGAPAKQLTLTLRRPK